MIPNTIFRNPFLSWILTSALIYSGLFWAYYVGLISHIYHNDFTHIAAGLLAVFVYVNLSLGVMAHKLQTFINNDEKQIYETSIFYTNFDVIGYFALTAPSLGFLGTVIGLTELMRDAATVDINTIAGLIGNGTGAALYPTGVGLVMFLVISFQKFLQTHAFRIYGFAREL